MESFPYNLPSMLPPPLNALPPTEALRNVQASQAQTHNSLIAEKPKVKADDQQVKKRKNLPKPENPVCMMCGTTSSTQFTRAVELEGDPQYRCNACYLRYRRGLKKKVREQIKAPRRCSNCGAVGDGLKLCRAPSSVGSGHWCRHCAGVWARDKHATRLCNRCKQKKQSSRWFSARDWNGGNWCQECFENSKMERATFLYNLKIEFEKSLKENGVKESNVQDGVASAAGKLKTDNNDGTPEDTNVGKDDLCDNLKPYEHIPKTCLICGKTTNSCKFSWAKDGTVGFWCSSCLSTCLRRHKRKMQELESENAKKMKEAPQMIGSAPATTADKVYGSFSQFHPGTNSYMYPHNMAFYSAVQNSMVQQAMMYPLMYQQMMNPYGGSSNPQAAGVYPYTVAPNMPIGNCAGSFPGMPAQSENTESSHQTHPQQQQGKTDEEAVASSQPTGSKPGVFQYRTLQSPLQHPHPHHPQSQGQVYPLQGYALTGQGHAAPGSLMMYPHSQQLPPPQQLGAFSLQPQQPQPQPQPHQMGDLTPTQPPASSYMLQPHPLMPSLAMAGGPAEEHTA